MTLPRRREALGAAMSFAALTIAGCGGGDRPAPAPADAVRAGAAAYLRALEDGRWDRACARMTGAARREIADAAGASCPRALAGGAALPRDQVATARREVPGADVRIDGPTASIGPLGGLPAPLRLQRVGGRWLISG